MRHAQSDLDRCHSPFAAIAASILRWGRSPRMNSQPTAQLATWGMRHSEHTMHTRRQFLAVAAAGAVTALFAGCASVPSFSGDALMSSLTGQGLTTNQAAGGLGAVMSLAQSKLPASDFVALSKYLPSSDKYLKVAQDMGLLKNPIRDVKQLNDAFATLGLESGQARSLLGSTSDYLTKQGGESARSLLVRALN